MADHGIALYLTDVQTPVLEFLHSVGMSDVVADERIYPTIELAVQHVEAKFRAQGDPSDSPPPLPGTGRTGSQPTP